MKFDLDKALQGAPVRLRNNSKAVVCFDMTSTGNIPLTNYPLRGYIVKSNGIDPSCWTKLGKSSRGSESPWDIEEMWEDIPEDILTTAYNQNKKVTINGTSYQYDVIGKHKNGSWLLEGEGHIFPLDENTKVSFVTVPSIKSIRESLPSPTKISSTQRVWFIRSGLASNQLVVDCRTAHPAELHVRTGNCFKTKKEAQAWIDALSKLASE